MKAENGLRWAERHAEWFFLAPALLGLFALTGFPLLFTLFMSLHDWELTSTQSPDFVGLGNFIEALSSNRFQESVVRTLLFTIPSVILPTAIGFLAAIVFIQHFRVRGVLRSLFILPMIATPAAMALIWGLMFHPTLGVLNYLLSLVGLPPSTWVYSSSTVIPSLVLVETWHQAPLMMLIILGGLATLPPHLFEAATVDGANGFQKFWYLTLPLVWPFLFLAILLRTIDALKVFDTIYVLTQGGPGNASETINIFLYLQSFVFYRIGYGSAIVVLFFLIVVGVSILLIRMRRRAEWQF